MSPRVRRTDLLLEVVKINATHQISARLSHQMYGEHHEAHQAPSYHPDHQLIVEPEHATLIN